MHPKAYLRQLISGQLHRALHIYRPDLCASNHRLIAVAGISTDDIGIHYALWELIVNSTTPQLSYPLSVIKTSLFGFRNESVLKTTRAVIDGLDFQDEFQHLHQAVVAYIIFSYHYHRHPQGTSSLAGVG